MRTLRQRKYSRSNHLGKPSYLERGVTEAEYQVYCEPARPPALWCATERSRARLSLRVQGSTTFGRGGWSTALRACHQARCGSIAWRRRSSSSRRFLRPDGSGRSRGRGQGWPFEVVLRVCNGYVTDHQDRTSAAGCRIGVVSQTMAAPSLAVMGRQAASRRALAFRLRRGVRVTTLRPCPSSISVPPPLVDYSHLKHT